MCEIVSLRRTRKLLATELRSNFASGASSMLVAAVITILGDLGLHRLRGISLAETAGSRRSSSPHGCVR